MKSLPVKEILVFGAVALAGWILTKLFDKLSDAGGAAGDAIGDAIAPLFVGPAVNVSGGAVLPDGQSVTWDTIVKEGGSLKALPGDVYTFNYRGLAYRVVPPRRADGRYDAVRA